MERKEAVLKVRDLMTENLVSVEAGESVIEAARLMDQNEISSIIVKEGKEFRGMITDRDIIGRVVSKGVDPGKIRVNEVIPKSTLTKAAILFVIMIPRSFKNPYGLCWLN